MLKLKAAELEWQMSSQKLSAMVQTFNQMSQHWDNQGYHPGGTLRITGSELAGWWEYSNPNFNITMVTVDSGEMWRPKCLNKAALVYNGISLTGIYWQPRVAGKWPQLRDDHWLVVSNMHRDGSSDDYSKKKHKSYLNL